MIYTPYNSGKTLVHQLTFTGLADFFEATEHGKTDMRREERASRRKESTQGDDWSGTSTFDEMMPLARNGWSDGRKTVMPIADYLSDLIGSRIMLPTQSWNVAGGSVDIGKFLTGEPDCMLDFTSKTAEGAGKIISINMNVSASWHVDKDAIKNRGAAVCALIDLLHQSGYTCELNALACCSESGWGSNGDHQCDVFIPVKKAEDILDEDHVSFMFMHPGILRRFVFSLEEQLPKQIRDAMGFHSHGGYGSVTKMPKNEEFLGDIFLEPLSWGNNHWSTVEASGKWIIGQLLKLGFKLDGIESPIDAEKAPAHF